MYGGKIMFILGVCWLVVWSVVAGLSQSELMLDFARAFAGLGPAAFLPSSIKLLGSVYRPGPRKNLVGPALSYPASLIGLSNFHFVPFDPFHKDFFHSKI